MQIQQGGALQHLMFGIKINVLDNILGILSTEDGVMLKALSILK